MLRHLTLLLTTTGVLTLFIAGCSSSGSQEQATESEMAQPISFPDHPDLKLGFTTQNFLAALPVTVASSKQFIDYAAEEGYSWLELRDPDADLTREECQEVADYAREKGIEVSYAIQKGVLDEDFWPTFEQGVQNAAVFEGPKLIRSLASGAEISGDESRQGWTEEELDRLVQYADSAAALAQSNGLQYVIENGGEAFFGEEGQYYGVADMFSRVGDAVGWQFDTANPFSVARVHADPDSVRSFLQEHADNLFYIHLKSARDGAAQEVLMDNPLPLGEIFQQLDDHGVAYVAIELQAVDNEEQAFANMRESREYLASQNFISNPE